MAVSHLELDNAIIQASQQLGYATIRPDQNRSIQSFMEVVMLLCATLCVRLPQSTNALNW
jgi:hypothetical protein